MTIEIRQISGNDPMSRFEYLRLMLDMGDRAYIPQGKRAIKKLKTLANRFKKEGKEDKERTANCLANDLQSLIDDIEKPFDDEDEKWK